MSGTVCMLTLGNMFSLGTCTSSIKIMPVTEARRLILPSILGELRPSMPLSRRKPLMSPWSSLAQTTNTSAMGELVIQFFDPESTQLPSDCCRALVSMLPGSLP